MYLGSISSLIHISLNNIDMFCLHIFVYVLSCCQINFMVSDGNWLRNSHNQLLLEYFLFDLGPSSVVCILEKRCDICMYIPTLCLSFILLCCSVLFVSISSSSHKRYLSTLVLDSKLILLNLGCFILIWSASRICNFLCYFVVLILLSFQ